MTDCIWTWTSAVLDASGCLFISNNCEYGSLSNRVVIRLIKPVGLSTRFEREPEKRRYSDSLYRSVAALAEAPIERKRRYGDRLYIKSREYPEAAEA